jgi:hypothetical protein
MRGNRRTVIKEDRGNFPPFPNQKGDLCRRVLELLKTVYNLPRVPFAHKIVPKMR